MSSVCVPAWTVVCLNACLGLQVMVEQRCASSTIGNLYQSWLMRANGVVFPGLPAVAREHIALYLVEDIDFEWEDDTEVLIAGWCCRIQ